MGEEIRIAEVERKTSETEIFMRLEIDGTGNHQIDTEIPFLGHMLALFSTHSLCNLKVWARGDVQVDEHHSVEDIGICLGQVIKESLGEKRGIKRYGSATIPMDEALIRVVLDFSGRPYLDYNVTVNVDKIGNFSSEMVEEFFRAVAMNASLTLHIDMLKGKNGHHIVEAIFKAFARAFKEACDYEPRVEGVWSSKGKL